MEDLINREDAIKAEWNKHPNMSQDECEAVFKDIPAVEPKQAWIPCSERLPHAEYGESDDVLVTCESKLIRLLYFDGGNWCYPTGERYEHRIDKVIAWMPLPKPWKGAGDEID